MTGSGLGKVPNYSPFVPHRTPHFRFSCSVLWPEISRQIIIFSEVISRAVSAQRSRKTRGPAPPYSTHARPHTYQYVFAPRPLYLCLISPRRNLLAGARRPFAAADPRAKARAREAKIFPTPVSLSFNIRTPSSPRHSTEGPRRDPVRPRQVGPHRQRAQSDRRRRGDPRAQAVP